MTSLRRSGSAIAMLPLYRMMDRPRPHIGESSCLWTTLVSQEPFEDLRPDVDISPGRHACSTSVPTCFWEAMPTSLMFVLNFMTPHPMMCICSSFDLRAVTMVINRIFNVRTAQVLMCQPFANHVLVRLWDPCPAGADMAVGCFHSRARPAAHEPRPEFTINDVACAKIPACHHHCGDLVHLAGADVVLMW